MNISENCKRDQVLERANQLLLANDINECENAKEVHTLLVELEESGVIALLYNRVRRMERFAPTSRSNYEGGEPKFLVKLAHCPPEAKLPHGLQVSCRSESDTHIETLEAQFQLCETK